MKRSSVFPARQEPIEPVHFIRCRGLLFTVFHAKRTAFSSDVSIKEDVKSVCGGGIVVVADATDVEVLVNGAVVLAIWIVVAVVCASLVACESENIAVVMPERVDAQRMIAVVMTSLRKEVNGERRESIGS